MTAMKTIIFAIFATVLLITHCNCLTLQGQVHRGNTGWGKRDLSGISRVCIVW